MIALLALALLQDAPIALDNAGRVKQIAELKGHSMPVFGLAFSPDGKRLASAGIDKAVRIWDLGAGKETAKFQHESQAIAVAFRSDGATLVSAGYEPAIRVWDLKAGKQIAESKQKSSSTKDQYLQIRTLGTTFNGDGTEVAYTLEGSWQVWLWNVDTRAQVELKTGRDVSERFSMLAYSSDGQWLAAQHEKPKGGKPSVAIWSVKEDKWTAELAGPEKASYCDEGIALSADGSKAACVDVRTSEIHTWDVKTGKFGAPLRGHKHDSDNPIMIIALAFNADGSVLSSVSYDATLKLWDVATGKELASLAGPKTGFAAAVFSRDGRRVATSGLDGTIQVWAVR